MTPKAAILLVAALGTLGTVATVGTVGTVGTAPAAAEALPQATADNRDAWVNPLVRADESEEQLTVTLDRVDTELVAGATLRATLTVTNHTGADIDAVQATPQQADPVSDATGVRAAQVADRFSYARYGPTVTLDGPLPAGESREIDVEFPAFASFAGAYPLLFSITADGAFVSTERTVVRVTAPEEQAETEAEPTPLTMLLPLTETLNIVPGETGEAPERAPLVLADESLAESMSEGGRLDALVDAYASHIDALHGAACLALDPALIDTAARMADGYVIADARADLTKPVVRLRDSWTQSDAAPSAVAGVGSQAAADWLARVRELAAAAGCTAQLPWANTDLNAVQRTANPWLMREALARGAGVIAEDVGVSPVDNLVIPGSGYVTEDTAPSLAWADDTGIELEEAWEILHADDRSAADATAGRSTLDDAALPDASAHPDEPAQTVQVLLADNTVWGAPTADRFANLAAGIQAVTYQDGLAATLATTGETPETVGYSNPDLRFDYELDSRAARDATAAATLALSLTGAETGAETEAEPVLVVPPADLDAATAEALLTVGESSLAAASATPLPLASYLTLDAEQAADLEAVTEAFGLARGDTPRFGAPYLDPAAYTDTEILGATQQANYTDDLTGIMINDPSIALTRYGFTAPLRRDVLQALTLVGRRGLGTFDAAVAATSRRLNANRDLLNSLRSSVALLPPGNVFTRTSASSPLLLVAQNGLPLPARATLGYQAPAGVTLATAEDALLLPARGSRTIQVTADIPNGDAGSSGGRTELTLWLAASDGAVISAPAQITVQTRATLAGTSAIAVVTLVVLVLALLFRVGRGRRKRNSG